ncbi:MAG: PEP/pyruvate-binding domain-containing protein [Bacteroidota bacterium]|jgi:pyruvate,orthophosphate dikinase|nr:PEP/pyruvate-binding domain-containing protein [Bacteroidota bacterium]
MISNPTFESAALRANLEKTRADQTQLPDPHKTLLDAAAAQFGVHNRLRLYLDEYHHPYPNKEWIVSQLRTILLQDFWFFHRHDRAPELLGILVGICDELLHGDAPITLHRRVVQTLLEFAEECAASGDDALVPVIDAALDTLETAMARDDMIAVVSSSLLPSIVEKVLHRPAHRDRLTLLLRTALAAGLAYWREGRSVERVLADYESLLPGGKDELLRSLGQPRFDALADALAQAATWSDLQRIPDFHTIAERFRAAADLFDSPLERAYYLSAVLPLPGLAHLKEHLLWDLNRVLRGVCGSSNHAEIETFLVELFHILGELRDEHMSTVLDCLQTLGAVIYASDDPVLIDHFTDAIIAFGFVHPELHNDDAVRARVERDHVKNIRVWLELIKANPTRSARLLSALIINLKLGGVFIQDNDLFQRDITALLNAGIQPVMFLVKQLAILFPVYFNEIGAEGELREISTVIDEIAGRRDRLIHFLRKQIHAESNNTHLHLTVEILRYWESGVTTTLEPLLRDDVVAWLPAGHAWFESSHKVVRLLCDELGCPAEELPAHPISVLSDAALRAFSPTDPSVQRVLHLCRIHQLLRQKYSISVEDIIPHMEKLHVIRAAEIEEFRALLKDNHPERILDFVLIMLHRLHAVILDENPSQGREDIYYKRHIAAGIPSMYGRYMEPKFQALGLAYRFEALATQLLARIVQETNLRYITAATLRRIHRILALFRRSLEIEGYSDEGFSSSVEMLRYGLSTTSFTIHQYVNLFQFLADNVKSIIYTNFLTPHEVQLGRIVPQYLPDEGDESEQTAGRHAFIERVYRDLISTTFPIQQLDNFIAAVLASMHDMLKHLTPDVIHGVMGYDSRLVTTRLFQSDPELDNPVFLGAKGYYLKRLYSLGFPVPPGFVITTELFRRRDAINRHPDMKAEFNELLRKRLTSLEGLSNERFGDPYRPLMLSVRSGAAISIPGAMNTFLNVGLNEEIVEGLSTRDNYGWTSWDCYRRFLQTWGMVQGIPRDEFDAVMVGFKERCGVELKIHFSPAQMRDIARTYRRVVLDHGVHIVEDPFEQLLQAVLMVLDSWYTDRAQVYRNKLQIAEDWGTAVVVQRMVLGNLNYDSGSGVVFTHDPFVRESGIFLYGDFTVCSQGEDIVAGLVHTLPISERQRLRSQTPVAESLEKDFPDVFKSLERHAAAIVYEHNFGHQEIEFTFETSRGEDLFILQTRDHSPTHDQQLPVFDIDAIKEHQVGSGIGIGGGALNGYICFDMDDLVALRRARPDAQLILVRPDTVPDDIGMIFECDGLLTARGGAASHAAVTAVRLHKTCVVDCRDMIVDEDHRTCTINGVRFQSGDALAIDGRRGSIYRGTFPVSFVQIQMP